MCLIFSKVIVSSVYFFFSPDKVECCLEELERAVASQCPCQSLPACPEEQGKASV